jgi:hypothetical protein
MGWVSFKNEVIARLTKIEAKMADLATAVADLGAAVTKLTSVIGTQVASLRDALTAVNTGSCCSTGYG